MILSPYQTAACKNHALTDIIESIVMNHIDGSLLNVEIGISEVGHSNTNVPVFTQPLCKAQFGNRPRVPAVVLDARPYSRPNSDRSNAASYSNPAEADFQKLRAKLQMIWQSESYPRTDLLQIGDIPGQAFLIWVGFSMSGKLGLDPEQALLVNVVTAYYYINLFYQEAEFSEDAKLRAVQTVARWTRLNTGRVLEIVEPLGYLANVNEYIGALHQVVDSPRIKQVGLGFLFSLLRGSWFGPNGAETVCVALEHPPTFIALVHSGLEQRSFRNYVLAKVAQKQVRAGNDRVFVNSLATVLKNFEG